MQSLVEEEKKTIEKLGEIIKSWLYIYEFI